jgi:subtilisin-like proprotein convertase family protein
LRRRRQGAARPLASSTIDIVHPYPGDLEISLVSPQGITLTVAHQLGHNAANSFHGTAWYDTAGSVNPPGAVTDAPFVAGTVQRNLAPQEAFGELNPRSPSGLWKLVVQDMATTDVGSLKNPTLQMSALTCRNMSLLLVRK